MSKLFYMNESGEWRELCELAETPEIAYNCEPLKDFAILKEINICHSCGRIGSLPFPHMNGKTYCHECLIKRMR